MPDKYTVRDFLVYFMTGSFLLLSLLPWVKASDSSLFDFFGINQDFIEKNSILTIFLLIPGIYILGHLVKGIDVIIYHIGKKKYMCKKANSKKIKWIVDLLYSALNGNRVERFFYNKEKEDIFWKRVNELQYNGKADFALYWSFMNQLHQCLTLILLGWAFIYLCNGYVWHFIISAALCVVTYFRARAMSEDFFYEIEYTMDKSGVEKERDAF